MPTTPNRSYPYPALANVPDVPADIEALATALDDDVLPKGGGTMTGLLTLSATPTSNLHAATKLYVDNRTPFEVRGGQATVSISTGAFAIAHGGGTAPVAFGATVRNLGAALVVLANGAFDGTNINFTAWTSFSTQASSGSVAIDWWALFTASGT